MDPIILIWSIYRPFMRSVVRNNLRALRRMIGVVQCAPRRLLHPTVLCKLAGIECSRAHGFPLFINKVC